MIIIGDVLFVIEAKAGNLPMQSPATNFASHERIIGALLVKAYEQCKRFVEYLASAGEVPLYELRDGQYIEIRRVRMRAFREILPIGLTVEAFTPFSAMAKELPGIVPILDKFPFVAMSVDDLFLLSRFLKNTGELLHYLRTRQQVAGIRNAMLFDETDHLGAYIQDNRFDLRILDQLQKASMVTWDAFSDIVDRYFEKPDWEAEPVPTQDMPPKFAEILTLLNKQRPNHWLEFDAHLRDSGGDGRNDIVRFLSKLEPTLEQHPRRRFDISGEDNLQIWICRVGEEPSDNDLRRYAQASCLTFEKSRSLVLTLSYSRVGVIALVKCSIVPAPSILQNDLDEIKRLAVAQRGRIQDLSKSQESKAGVRKKRRNRI